MREQVTGAARLNPRNLVSDYVVEPLESRVLLALASFPNEAYPVGNDPWAMASGDLNADGWPDIVTANFNGPESISVLMNRRDGTFQPAPVHGTGDGAISVVLADVNGDGKLDALVAGAKSEIDVLPGQGDGSFQAPTTISLGRLPTSMAVGDVDGDGQVDIVVGLESRHSSIRIYRGDGKGGFQVRKTMSIADQLGQIGLVDVNADGRLDLLAIIGAGTPAGVPVAALGRGDGSFGAPAVVSTDADVSSFTTADLNRDGRMDLVLAHRASRNVSVIPGKGNGTFQSGTQYRVNSLSANVAIADVNRDGRLDLIVANGRNYDSATAAIFLGDGDGTFKQTMHQYFVGAGCNALAVIDLDQNGNPDLVTANQALRTNGSVSALGGFGDGTFSLLSTFHAGGSYIPSMAAADVNGDRRVDVVTATNSSVHPAVSILLGASGGTFDRRQTIPVGADPSCVAIADLNGDGRPDVVVANQGDDTVGVVLGTGHSRFGIHHAYTAGAGPDALTVADFNGDGKLDVISANFNAGTISVLLGNGDGTLQTGSEFAAGDSPTAICAADSNGDGRQDVVVASNNGSASLLLGNGDGTFQAPSVVVSAGASNSIVAADLNGDGRPDIVAGSLSSSADQISVVLGNGDGTFQRRRLFTVGANPRSVCVSDVNGDGKPDIIAANNDSGSVSVLLGIGNGNFLPQQMFLVGDSPQAMVAADLDNDGRADILTANQNFAELTLLPNAGWAHLENGTLTVEGTPDADQIRVLHEGATLTAIRGNGCVTFRYAGIARVNVAAGDGNDLVSIGAGVMGVTLSGGRGRDQLVGGPGNDWIAGGSGIDYIYGGDGNDCLEGDQGNDLIDGDHGDDRIFGGDGSDRLSGSYGSDRILGGAGDDIIFDGPQRDLIDGQEGNDTLYGGGERDRIYGGEGDDSIFDVGHFEEATQTSDQDIFHSSELLTRDTLDGGPGSDTASTDQFDVVLAVERQLKRSESQELGRG